MRHDVACFTFVFRAPRDRKQWRAAHTEQQCKSGDERDDREADSESRERALTDVGDVSNEDSVNDVIEQGGKLRYYERDCLAQYYQRYVSFTEICLIHNSNYTLI